MSVATLYPDTTVPEANTLAPALDFKNWNLQFLTDFIINVHHDYVKATKEVILDMAKKAASAHGNEFPGFISIAEIFATLVTDLSRHLAREESLLFPYVTVLLEARHAGHKIPAQTFASLAEMIDLMETEHAQAGTEFKLIREITAGYTLPASAVDSTLYHKLQEFEADLKQHIYLEDYILFPKAIEMEKELQLA